MNVSSSSLALINASVATDGQSSERAELLGRGGGGGTELRVAYWTESVYAESRCGSCRLQGLDVDLFHLLCASSGFVCRYTRVPPPQDTGNASIPGLLADQRFHAILNSFDIAPEYASVYGLHGTDVYAEFSHDEVIVTRNSQFGSYTFNLGQMISPGATGLLFVLVVFITLVLIYREGRPSVESVGRHLLAAYGPIVRESGAASNRIWPVLVAIYQMTLFVGFNGPLDAKFRLERSPVRPYPSLYGDISELMPRYLEGRLRFVSEYDLQPVLRAAGFQNWSIVANPPLRLSTLHNVLKHIAAHENAVSWMSRLELEPFATKDPMLVEQLVISPLRYPLAVYVPWGFLFCASPLCKQARDIFARQISRMPAGIHHVIRRHIPQVVVAPPRMSDPLPLSINEFIFVLQLLGCGLSLSLIAFGLERALWRRWRIRRWGLSSNPTSSFPAALSLRTESSPL